MQERLLCGQHASLALKAIKRVGQIEHNTYAGVSYITAFPSEYTATRPTIDDRLFANSVYSYLSHVVIYQIPLSVQKGPSQGPCTGDSINTALNGNIVPICGLI